MSTPQPAALRRNRVPSFRLESKRGNVTKVRLQQHRHISIRSVGYAIRSLVRLMSLVRDMREGLVTDPEERRVLAAAKAEQEQARQAAEEVGLQRQLSQMSFQRRMSLTREGSFRREGSIRRSVSFAAPDGVPEIRAVQADPGALEGDMSFRSATSSPGEAKLSKSPIMDLAFLPPLVMAPEIATRRERNNDEVSLDLSVCSSNSNDRISEDGEQRMYFPGADELWTLPFVLQQHVLGRARLCLLRFIFMFRLKKAIKARQLLRNTPKLEEISPQLWSSSSTFAEWPSGLLATLLRGCRTDLFYPNVFLHYYGQPRPHVILLLEGTVVAIDRKARPPKAVSVRNNGRVVRTFTGPRVINDTLLFVGDEFPYALQAVSRVRAILIDPATVEHLVASMPHEARRRLHDHCVELRRERARLSATSAVVAWSPLFGHRLSAVQREDVFRGMEVQSFLAGDTVLSRRDDDPHCMFFVLHGTVDGVGASRKHDKTWGTKLFATFTTGSTIGERSLYFRENYLYSLVARTHCDVLVLKAAALNALVVMDRDLNRQVAEGAFAVRGADASVRLLLQSPRNIPPILFAIQQAIITDAFVREMLNLFRFRIVPAGELITNKSCVVREVVVLVSGTAAAATSGVESLVMPLHVAFGGHMLSGTRWRYNILAQTACEGWFLGIADFVALARRHSVFGPLRDAASSLLDQSLNAANNSLVMEVPTPQVVKELLDGDDTKTAARRKGLVPMRTYGRAFELVSCALRPPLPPPSITDTATTTAKTRQVDDRIATRTAHREHTSLAAFVLSAPVPTYASAGTSHHQTSPAFRRPPPKLSPLRVVGSLSERIHRAGTQRALSQL